MRLDSPSKQLERSAEEMPGDGDGPSNERLFRAVIVQALEDATMYVAEIEPRHTTTRRAELRTKAADRDEARRWLLEDEADFPDVCELAGVCPGRCETMRGNG